MEIERKFQLKGFPDLETRSECIIKQYFLSVKPYVRIRSKQTDKKINYKLCIKSEGDLSRTEIEFKLTEDEFSQLKAMCKEPPIIKLHKTYKLPDGNILECNSVDEDLDSGFMYAEIEFDSEQEAKEFIPPSFLGKEMTYDKDQKMNVYWDKTRGDQ